MKKKIALIIPLLCVVLLGFASQAAAPAPEYPMTVSERIPGQYHFTIRSGSYRWHDGQVYLSVILTFRNDGDTGLAIGFQAWAPGWPSGPAIVIPIGVDPRDVLIYPIIKGMSPSDVFEPGDVAFFVLEVLGVDAHAGIIQIPPPPQ